MSKFGSVSTRLWSLCLSLLLGLIVVEGSASLSAARDLILEAICGFEADASVGAHQWWLQ